MDNLQGVIEELTEYIKYLSEEIEAIKAENKELRKQIISICRSLKTVAENQNIFSPQLENIIKTINALVNDERILLNRTENIAYELCDPDNHFQFMRPHFEPQEETVRKIIEERKSLARFGDGEFSIMGNVERWKFQHFDEKLAKRLVEVLQSDLSDLIIAIADNYGSLDRYATECADGIRTYMTESTRKLHYSLLDKKRIYADAYMTRFYVMYKDNMTEASEIRLKRLKSIWDKRHVITIEGALTRLGVDNDLFANTESFRRIIAPATNSFDKYEECLQAALEYAEPETLFLLAVGPSSGVFAYDLTLNGYQAIDVGHIDLEYEWYRIGQGRRVSVPGRYNNEVEGGEQVRPLSPENPYYNEILVSFAE